jgi:hypothetical protein
MTDLDITDRDVRGAMDVEWLMRRQVGRVRAADPGQLSDADRALLRYGPGIAERAAARVAAHGAQHWTWGAQFLASPAWQNRRGYLTDGAAVVAAYLEERADITTGDTGALTSVLQSGPPSPLVAPIAARCAPVPASVGSATLVRWSGPLRPPPTAEGDLKPGAVMTPTVAPLAIPYCGAWIGLTRQVLDDEPALSAVIDGRLRRALGLALDDSIAAAIAADEEIATVSGADLAASILLAIGALAADGYAGNLAALVNPADYASLGAVNELTALGVGAILPTAGTPEGTVIVADLFAAVQVRTVGAARIMTTDSHADMFLKNELVILAEARVAGVVTDPAVAVLATATGRAATATSRRRAG